MRIFLSKVINRKTINEKFRLNNKILRNFLNFENLYEIRKKINELKDAELVNIVNKIIKNYETQKEFYGNKLKYSI